MSELIFWLVIAGGVFMIGFVNGWLWGAHATLKALRPKSGSVMKGIAG